MKVVLNDTVAMLQGIGEQTPNECNVSYAEDFWFSVTVSVEIRLYTKLVQAEGSVRLHMD